MTQQTDTEALISKVGLTTANGTSTPYQSGHPVDAVPDIDLPLHEAKRSPQQAHARTGRLYELALNSNQT